MTEQDAELLKLKVGPKSREWLNSIGIYTRADLAQLGVVATYLRLKEVFPHKISLNMLYGLEAALLGIDWRLISEERKAELRREVEDSAN